MYACRAEEKANENDAIITSSTRNLVVEKILLYCLLNLFLFKLLVFQLQKQSPIQSNAL